MPIATRAAIYARVSTDLQEKEHTIQGEAEVALIQKFVGERMPPS